MYQARARPRPRGRRPSDAAQQAFWKIMTPQAAQMLETRVNIEPEWEIRLWNHGLNHSHTSAQNCSQICFFSCFLWWKCSRALIWFDLDPAGYHRSVFADLSQRSTLVDNDNNLLVNQCAHKSKNQEEKTVNAGLCEGRIPTIGRAKVTSQTDALFLWTQCYTTQRGQKRVSIQKCTFLHRAAPKLHIRHPHGPAINNKSTYLYSATRGRSDVIINMW